MGTKRVIQFINENGQYEYHLVGFDSYDDFDIIIKYLVEKEGVLVLEVLNGIYSRIGKINIANIEFKLIFHEDVGNYLIFNQRDLEKNKWLENWVENIIFGL